MSDVLLTAEQMQFLESVRGFVDSEIIPHATEWDLQEAYPKNLLRKFGDLGWLGVTVPEA